ncbi:MAG TPA: hypothetical protein PKK50_05050 [Myxococcota bacterium]|nr:hypothetical protein [Myxococcota bacterium]
MKLCIVGAGSTRLPLMMASLVRPGGPVENVSLFDIRPRRMEALFPVGLELCRHIGTPPRFNISSSVEEAVEGCDALIVTIRPGFEEQRARDERVCLDMGVIGQETVGPAGFAFATRTIPAVAVLFNVARRLSPGFMPIIFSNPAGMVTRAMLDLGFENAVGICDSATVAATKVAARAGIDPTVVEFEVSGLNHLSWTRRVMSPDGADLLPAALADEAFVRDVLGWLEPRPEGIRDFPVEYLYYYMYPGRALDAMKAEPLSRGEALATANAELFDALRGAGVADSITAYARYLAGRNGSYMSYASVRHAAGIDGASPLDYLAGQAGGYADVAMDLLDATHGGPARVMALNVRNGSSIPELSPDDVVETDCRIERGCINPRGHEPMPATQARMVDDIARYERLAVSSVLTSMRGESGPARAIALDALTAHPLISNRDLAGRILEELSIRF